MSLSTLTLMTDARRSALWPRPWLVVAFLLVATSVVSPRPAEATCRQSQIALGVASPVVGATVPVSWAITPACDVIKTGLLFGTSRQALAPAGQPTYNVLSSYHESLSVGQSGAYWVAAYAVDEAGIQISFLVASGDPATVTINGQRAQLDSPIRCFEDPPVCFGNASWDPTAAAVAQIGGELPMSFDPNPPAFDGIRGFEHARFAGYGLNMSVNYPWATLGTNFVLELTYQQTCPKQLNLTITPSSVRPVIGGAAENATVQAFVHTCPPGGGGPASVDVTLTVQPPHPGDPGAADGGHRHGERPSKAFGTLNGQNQQPVTCTVNIDPTGMGSCTVTYRPSEVSGVETVTASAVGLPSTQAQIPVEVPDLENLTNALTNFFQLTGQTQTHPDNHWATSETARKIQLLAFDVFRLFGVKLGINDMSLSRGGLFDICGTWNPDDGCTITRLDGTTARIKKGHFGHRTGTSVDVDRSACLDPNLVGNCGKFEVNKVLFQFLCNNRGGTRAPEESLHCEF